MTHAPPALRVRYCSDCDGFPIVAIDTGTLHADGTRRTLRVACPGCAGTGVAPVSRRASAEVRA